MPSALIPCPRGGPLPGAKPKRISNIEHPISNVEGVLDFYFLLESPLSAPRAAGLKKFDQNF